MAHVLGIPLIKGNSNVVMACGIAPQATVVIEGVFVSRIGGSIEPIVSDLNQGALFGLAMDINACSQKCSVVRGAELVLARTDGTAPPNGTKLLVDTNGLVSATGTYTLNGDVMSELQEGINGKTGETVADCVLISINTVEFDGGAPLATAKTASTTKTDVKK